MNFKVFFKKGSCLDQTLPYDDKEAFRTNIEALPYMRKTNPKTVNLDKENRIRLARYCQNKLRKNPKFLKQL